MIDFEDIQGVISKRAVEMVEGKTVLYEHGDMEEDMACELCIFVWRASYVDTFSDLERPRYSSRWSPAYPVAPNLPKGAAISTIDCKDLNQHANRKSSATKV